MHFSTEDIQSCRHCEIPKFQIGSPLTVVCLDRNWSAGVLPRYRNVCAVNWEEISTLDDIVTGGTLSTQEGSQYISGYLEYTGGC